MVGELNNMVSIFDVTFAGAAWALLHAGVVSVNDLICWDQFMYQLCYLNPPPVVPFNSKMMCLPIYCLAYCRAPLVPLADIIQEPLLCCYSPNQFLAWIMAAINFHRDLEPGCVWSILGRFVDCAH
jgi:hypothetical protein